MKFDLKLSDLINLPTTFLTAILIASGAVLFSPEQFLNRLYMLEFRENYGFAIGLVFLICFSLLIVNLIYQASQSIKNNRNKRNFFTSAESRLMKLNEYQKTIIYLLFIQDNRTYPLPIHDGAVLELETELMIGKVGGQYYTNDLNNAVFPYMLQPWVSEELSTKQSLIDEFENAYETKKNSLRRANEWEW